MSMDVIEISSDKSLTSTIMNMYNRREIQVLLDTRKKMCLSTEFKTLIFVYIYTYWILPEPIQQPQRM